MRRMVTRVSWVRPSLFLALSATIGCVTACGDDDGGGKGTSGGSSGRAGATSKGGSAGSGASSGSTNGGSGGSTGGTGGTAGKAAGGSAGTGTAGSAGSAGTAGSSGGTAGSGNPQGGSSGRDDGGEAGLGGESGASGAGAGGESGDDFGGAGGEGGTPGSGGNATGGVSGSSGSSGSGGAGSGGAGSGGAGSGGAGAGGAGAGGAGSGGAGAGGAGSGGTAGTGGAPSAPNLFFSEYLENTGDLADALEIYNAGSTPANLSNCRILVYNAGATTIRSTVNLSGTLAPGGIQVACTSALAEICTVNAAISFDGDNPVALECTVGSANATLDVIGLIGTDPGDQWGTSPLDTRNVRLTRACSTTTGDTNGANEYPLTGVWTNSAIATSGLGVRGCP